MSKVDSNFRGRLESYHQYYWYMSITIALALFTFSNLNFGESLLLDYTKYTSDKYLIEFNYPSNWILTERTDNPQQPRDIIIKDNGMGGGQIGIGYAADLVRGFGTTDLAAAIVDFHKEYVSNPQSYSRTILYPSFTNIGGHVTGTFLYSFAGGKTEIDPIAGVRQFWITYVGNHGYSYGFISTPESFLTPEYTEVREQFINSIKFLDGNGQFPGSPTN